VNWQKNLITTIEQIRELLSETKSIAVLGIKTEAQASQPAFYVPNYLRSAGFDIIPVPVYYPAVTHILGKSVYRTLEEIPTEVDMVNVFRRSEDVSAHLDDILAKKAKSVWMQSGISNAAVAERLAKEGIKVVQDRCLMVDHRRLFGSAGILPAMPRDRD
jgi:predicted CoA-binding protein